MLFVNLFLLYLSLSHSEIIFNLQKEDNSNFYSNFLSDLITYLELGNPIQKIPAKITLSNNYYYIIGEGNETFFEKEKSLSFNLGDKADVMNLPFKEGYFSNDIFQFEYLNKSKNEFKNFPFLYAFKPKNTKENFYSQIGFSSRNIQHGNKYNLVNRLKKLNLIKSNIYYFDFNNNNFKIVIGEYAEKYQKETNSEFIYTNIDTTLYLENINIEFDNFSYGNNTLNSTINVEFDFSVDGLIGNDNFKKEINELFFKKYIENKMCSLITYKGKLFYECNNKINIEEFPSLKFYHKSMNISLEFNNKDLFNKIQDKYYFMIAFNIKIVYTWTFGCLFFKKYKTLINSDRRTIGIYIPLSNNKNSIWIKFVIIFILLFIIMILVFYYVRLLKNKRRHRVNEIEENIDYTSIKI